MQENTNKLKIVNIISIALTALNKQAKYLFFYFS